ncbi:hypothetical protein D3C83_17840 [compost metagenome]
MPVVEGDVEALQVFRPLGGDARHELARRHAFRLRLEHDGRAVGVVGAHEVHLVAAHALESHPDVGLDVLHDVPDVERAVRVGQRSGDEKPASGHGPARERRDFSLHFKHVPQ